MVVGTWLAAPSLLAQTAAQAPTQTAVQAPTQTAVQTPTPAAPKPHKHHKTPPKPLVLPPLPVGPLSQVPMDQLPPTPANVSYQGGLLTISAQNATLGEILRDVRKLTGASIEIPKDSSGASERVVAHLGPGAPRDVLAVLLNGTSFNYVMLGSPSDPLAVASVILMTRTSATGEAQTAANGNPGAAPVNRFAPPFNQQAMAQPGQHPGAQTVEAEDNADDADDADDNADDQTQPAQPAANVQQQPDPNQPNAGPRTPEQVLDMLQRQRQQPGALPPPQPPQ
jgi:hypothetical protein